MTFRPLGSNENFITIELRDVYGKPTVYPAGKAATAFASIAKSKTLTPDTLILILSLGYAVAEVYRGDIVGVWRAGEGRSSGYDLHALCARVSAFLRARDGAFRP